MSCNGCRVLRKGCSETCILRPCLQWIESPEAQGHATVFVAKFFGRAGIMSFISNVPEKQRPALFQSLLFEAAGRTVNPVNGAVGLLGTSNWHVCQAAVETVLRGGVLKPMTEFIALQSGNDSECADIFKVESDPSRVKRRRGPPAKVTRLAGLDPDLSLNSEESVTTTCTGGDDQQLVHHEIKLLDLFN